VIGISLDAVSKSRLSFSQAAKLKELVVDSRWRLRASSSTAGPRHFSMMSSGLRPKSPAQNFIDSIPLAEGKLIAAALEEQLTTKT
jgi:hypothetical protein